MRPNHILKEIYCRAKKLLWSLSFVPKCVDMTTRHTCSLRRIDVITVHHVDIYRFNGVQSRDSVSLTYSLLQYNVQINPPRHLHLPSNSYQNAKPQHRRSQPTSRAHRSWSCRRQYGPPILPPTSSHALCRSSHFANIDSQMVPTASHPPQPKRFRPEM